MEFLGALAVILTNVVILGLLILIWKWVQRRGPMTAARLRTTVNWNSIPPADTLPCGGNLDATGALLRILEQGGTANMLLRALFVQWEQQGYISVCNAEKKKLRGFGADIQAQLTFLASALPATDTAGKLFAYIAQWQADDHTLQESELYQAARTAAPQLDLILQQLQQDGVRALRDLGGSAPEGKKAKFGFSAQEREIYTTKGVRLAKEVAAYSHFCKTAQGLTGHSQVIAVLTGAENDISPALLTLADTMWKGMQAGLQPSHS